MDELFQQGCLVFGHAFFLLCFPTCSEIGINLILLYLFVF